MAQRRYAPSQREEPSVAKPSPIRNERGSRAVRMARRSKIYRGEEEWGGGAALTTTWLQHEVIGSLGQSSRDRRYVQALAGSWVRWSIPTLLRGSEVPPLSSQVLRVEFSTWPVCSGMQPPILQARRNRANGGRRHCADITVRPVIKAQLPTQKRQRGFLSERLVTWGLDPTRRKKEELHRVPSWIARNSGSREAEGQAFVRSGGDGPSSRPPISKPLRTTHHIPGLADTGDTSQQVTNTRHRTPKHAFLRRLSEENRSQTLHSGFPQYTTHSPGFFAGVCFGKHGKMRAEDERAYVRKNGTAVAAPHAADADGATGGTNVLLSGLRPAAAPAALPPLHGPRSHRRSLHNTAVHNTETFLDYCECAEMQKCVLNPWFVVSCAEKGSLSCPFSSIRERSEDEPRCKPRNNKEQGKAFAYSARALGGSPLARALSDVVPEFQVFPGFVKAMSPSSGTGFGLEYPQSVEMFKAFQVWPVLPRSEEVSHPEFISLQMTMVLPEGSATLADCFHQVLICGRLPQLRLDYSSTVQDMVSKQSRAWKNTLCCMFEMSCSGSGEKASQLMAQSN
ncbi:hypothetical protein P4O66_006683 [Electrophorus voltai]|uniref:Uncharacterized protein n=1 Tax=Electrophorus voltai TaxID=2609070 RepID=A0AAD8ZH94_9TELE|nr:hypothetical protein P4O66_006683 [Electrophorus voltai]